MNEGWKCPVCGLGVAPGKITCDHGKGALPINPYLPLPPTITPTNPPWDWPPRPIYGGCPACRNGGICNCVRPLPYSTCGTQA